AGKTDEGLRELDTAIRLSPRDPQLWTFHAGKQVVLWNAGRYEEAREASERALEVDPESAAATAYSNIAATSAVLGDLPRAPDARYGRPLFPPREVRRRRHGREPRANGGLASVLPHRDGHRRRGQPVLLGRPG